MFRLTAVGILIAPSSLSQSPLDQQRKVLFTLDKPSPSICLLVQLERTATEEDGVKASAYSKKDVVGYKQHHLFHLHHELSQTAS